MERWLLELVDVLHINNKLLFIIGISKHIKYYQCVGIKNKSTATFLNMIKLFKSNYGLRGFKRTTCYTLTECLNYARRI